MKNDTKTYRYQLTLETLGIVSDELKKFLARRRTDEKDISAALLLLEEISVRFLEHDPDTPISVRVRDRFGSITLILSQESEDYNPISEIRDWGTESEDYFRTLIFRANAEKLDYARQSGKNVVLIKARRPKFHMVILAVIMLLLGIVLGLVFRHVLSPDQIAFVDYNIFDIVQTMFFHALGMLIVPMIFFSVVSTISGLSSLSDTGRLGAKALRTYFMTTLTAIVLGFGAAFLILPAKLTGPIQVLAENYKPGEATDLFGRDLLINLIPTDLVAPIQDANIMQVMLLAVFVGIALGVLGEKIQVVNQFVADMTKLFQTLVNMVAAFMPLITLAATASLLMIIGSSVLPILLRLILAELIAVLVLWVLYSLQLVSAGLSPVPFWKALPGYFRKAGLPNYSGGYLPYSMELCTRKFGVSPRVTSFTTSLGASINMDGACIHFVLCSVLFARLYGIPLDAKMIATIAVAVFILSMGDSAVQNSSLISMTGILTLMGAPTAALGLILGIDAILDIFRCGSNIIGDLVATIAIGKSEGEMTVEKYQS